MGDRLYVSYWHHGLFILDISDMIEAEGRSRSSIPSPAFPHPTHTCLRMPQKLKGRDIMVVADEDVAKLRPSAPAFTWIYDITDERSRFPIATFQVPGLDKDGAPQPRDDRLPPALRALQRARSFRSRGSRKGCGSSTSPTRSRRRRSAHYLPDAPKGAERASSNDVTIDDRGLIYLVDRIRGVDIIETSVMN